MWRWALYFIGKKGVSDKKRLGSTGLKEIWMCWQCCESCVFINCKVRTYFQTHAYEEISIKRSMPATTQALICLSLTQIILSFQTQTPGTHLGKKNLIMSPKLLNYLPFLISLHLPKKKNKTKKSTLNSSVKSQSLFYTLWKNWKKWFFFGKVNTTEKNPM